MGERKVYFKALIFMSMENLLKKKADCLLERLTAYESPVVLFSGGVDSTVLAAAARRADNGRVAAVTVISPTMPLAEVKDASRLAAVLGLEHFELNLDETLLPEFAANDKERCYHCKKYRLEIITRWAEQNGFVELLDGSNADDGLDYRPGMKALAECRKAVSPLKDCGLTKSDIRDLARAWGLDVWDKPAAACLASRLAYGLTVTKERLAAVEKAELIIKEYCPDGSIRVRHHGDLARIEVERAYIYLLSAPRAAGEINGRLKELGFTFVALDLGGYSTGSLNKILE